MSPRMVVIAGVLALVVQCWGSSWAMTEPGLQELVALDEVLRDLQGVLESRRELELVTLTETPTGVGNTSYHEGVSVGATEDQSGSFLPWRDEAEEVTGHGSRASPRRPSRRVKRVSPTPPPSRCPEVQLPHHLSKWEQLRYLVSARPHGCHHHGCCQRRRDPCPYKAEVLVARLGLLEGRLQEVDRLEARLKIHITLLTNIQASGKYPGQPGEPGPPGRKGHQGFKGLPGHSGGTGSCRITGQPDPPAGPPGSPGNKGNPGAPGDKVCGCDGARGDTGTPGANRRGRQGPRGLKGPKGERGRDLPILHG